MFRPLTHRQLGFDLTVAAGCVLLRLVVMVNGGGGAGGSGGGVVVVTVLMALALGIRRLSPGLALAVAWLGAIIQLALGLDPDAANLAILPVLYATASYGTPRVKWLGLASSGLGALVIAVYLGLSWNRLNWPLDRSGQEQIRQGLIMFALAFTAFALSWTLGLLAKTWRNARESAQARVRAERERLDAQDDVRVEQERGRIARDMHDVVAHSLAVVIAQADGARYARASDPDAVDQALGTISATAREALGDVRLLLAQLRHDEPAGPQPMLSDIDRLLVQLRDAGLTIDFHQTGQAIPLGAGRQLAVYRIVQEALTNALRHGDRTRPVFVRFDWSAQELGVSVDSAVAPDAAPNTPAGAAHPGHGLAGMRERAALAGGSFTAEARDDRFVVRATLPIAAPEATA
jgi:signal transduction histidine kinase